jgi:hypothetical protein
MLVVSIRNFLIERKSTSRLNTSISCDIIMVENLIAIVLEIIECLVKLKFFFL